MSSGASTYIFSRRGSGPQLSPMAKCTPVGGKKTRERATEFVCILINPHTKGRGRMTKEREKDSSRRQMGQRNMEHGEMMN
jgi:hypothetical protein